MTQRGSFRAVPVLALALAGAACGRPAPGTSFFNFDAESTSGRLSSGWSSFEKTPAGDTFVWAQAREAALTVTAEGPADRLVRFRAWPLGWPGAPPQTATVWVNDVRLEAVRLEDGPRVYSVASPGPAWKSGANVLKFEFAWAEAPKDRLPGGGDTRTLAAAFDWLEILPAGEAGPAPSAPRTP